MKVFYKKGLLPLVLITSINVSVSQKLVDTIAINLMIKGDSLLNCKKYKYARNLYYQVNQCSFFPLNQVYEMIALTYFYEKKKDSAFIYMEKSVNAGKYYWSEKSLMYDKETLEILSIDSSEAVLRKLKNNTLLFLNSDSLAQYKSFLKQLTILKKK